MALNNKVHDRLSRMSAKKLNRIVIFSVALQCLIHYSSYSQFTITGEIRPRAEFRNGFKKLHSDEEDPAFFIEQRSRIYLDYKAEKIKFMLSLQDVRVWGNVDQIYKSDPTLSNVREAWGEYNLSRKLSIKAGRQAISYDNERFLGALEWAQQGRVHDALLVKFQDDSARVQLHVGAAYNQNILNEPARLSSTFYGGVNNYKTMQYLWFHKDYGKSKFSFVFLNDGRQRPTDSTMYYKQTYGFYGQKKIGMLSLTGEFYYQGGRTLAVANNKLNAYMAAINFGLDIVKIPLVLGFDYLSGTSASDTKNTSFDPSFGTNHSFYGYMDYFYVGNAHGQNQKIAGLMDVYFRSTFKTSTSSNLKLDLHYFSSAADVYDPLSSTTTVSKGLGTEVDIVFTATISTAVSWNIGYSQMFGTSSLELLKGNTGDKDLMNNWAWTMLTIKPILFQQKNP